MSQVQIPNSDHCIWRARINHLCKSGLDPIDCKSSSQFFKGLKRGLLTKIRRSQCLQGWSQMVLSGFKQRNPNPWHLITKVCSDILFWLMSLHTWYSSISLQAALWSWMQFLELAYSYISLYAVLQACIQFYGLASSPKCLHAFS